MSVRLRYEFFAVSPPARSVGPGSLSEARYTAELTVLVDDVNHLASDYRRQERFVPRFGGAMQGGEQC